MGVIWNLVVVVASFFFCIYLDLSGNDPDLAQVQTKYGKIQGNLVTSHLGGDSLVEEFLGIPYAAPPVGERRFTYPVAPEPYKNGVLDASRYPPQCMNKPLHGEDVPMSEDCLYLNVYRPRPVKHNRAVMVWIHGGAFKVHFNYEGYLATNNATTLAYVGDVIVVTLHYRMGVFGSLHTGDDRIKGGNFGLKDQQMALRWVHENIRDFGGDPSLVTMFGESAGGHSVSNLLLMQDNQHLFTRAIVQSGSSTSYRGCLSLEYITQNVAGISRRTGCPDDRGLLPCLRRLPAEELLHLTWPPMNVLKIPHIPAADGESIPGMPADLLKEGRVLHKDILLGSNRNEGTMYVVRMIPNVTAETIERDPEAAYNRAVDELVKERILTPAQIEAIRKHYRPSDPHDITETYRCIGEVYGDVTYKCPVQEAAQHYNRLGMKVYQYYLNYRSSLRLYPDWMGVAHTEDIQWVFGHPFDPERGYTQAEVTMSRDVMTWWSNFAKYGAPSPSWPAHSCERSQHLRIDGPGEYPVINHPVDWDKCRLWGYQ